MQASTGELPLCPICCELLGKYGGVTTLPCGHNGCLDCFAHVQSRHPMCPLCRAPFHPQQPLACNYELRDLIQMATSVYMDETTKEEGWEAFPTAKLMTAHYVHEVKSERRKQPPSNFLGSQSSAAGSSSNSALLQANQIAGAHTANSYNGDMSNSTLVQYHDDYHQHPGLPQSAPSGTQRDVLTLEPPQWLPDSYASHCGGCQLPFKAIVRLRHHCRLCGKLFCHSCSSKQLLLPPRFKERDPQRVCDMCASLLEPLQPFLVGATAASVQPPVHDALDAISLRSWLNSPWNSSMADELYKAANILRCFNEAARLEPERSVPTSMLAGAKGLALLSAVRLGAGWSCTAGTGIVVSRQRNDAWSAPCAVACYGVGWGLQLGGELTDVLLVLKTEEAVRAFAAGQTIGIGGNAGIALGPLGRKAETSMRVGGFTARGSVVGYSCSKGAFVGVSLEGSVTAARSAVNHRFYGYPVTPQQLLVDCTVPQPPAAATLYETLDTVMDRWEHRGLLVHTKSAVAPMTCSIAAADDAVGASCSSKSCRTSAAASREQETAAQFIASSSGSSNYQYHQQPERAGDFGRLRAGAASAPDAVAATAPPAPASMLHAINNRNRSSARQQQQQQQRHDVVDAAIAELPSAPTARVQQLHEESEEEEEPQYVLEW